MLYIDYLTYYNSQYVPSAWQLVDKYPYYVFQCLIEALTICGLFAVRFQELRTEMNFELSQYGDGRGQMLFCYLSNLTAEAIL